MTRAATPADLARIAACAVGAAVALFAFFHPDLGNRFLGAAILLGAYGGASAWIVRRARRDGDAHIFRPRRGDITLAALVTAIMYFAAMGASHLLAPATSPEEAWMIRLYALFGDPFDDRRHLLAGMLFLIGIGEEIVWRGYVMRTLAKRISPLRAALVAAILYAAVHVPTLFLLSAERPGPNPLIVIAALASGLVWGYVVVRTDRLPIAYFSHGLLTWAAIEFPLWRIHFAAG